MDAEALRSWWATRQGLPMGMPGASPADVLSRSGWARSIGGANPYLTLWSRAGTSRAEAEAAMKRLEIHELPSARGCTYIVPAEDFGLALRLSQGTREDPAFATARKFLGVTDAEVETLCREVLGALADGGPKDPAAIRTAVGGAARSLGEEGKKRGQTTTLPLALGRLQARGEIRRKPTNDRLDQQRYAYVRWADGPPRGMDISHEEATVELARRFFRWIGPASLAHFSWFSGLGVRATKAALEPLGLVPLQEGSDLLVLPEDRDAVLAHTLPAEPNYVLVSALDAIFLLRRDIRPLLDEADLSRKSAGDRGLVESGGLQDLSNNAILDRGRIVGLWEYEPATASIVWASFVPVTDDLTAAVARTEAFIRDDLGDCRSFSLDSPASRQKSIETLRSLTAG